MIRQTNSESIDVLSADGSPIGVVPNQHILATLNQFGKEGWGVIQGGPNPDSSGVTYLLKRRV